MEPQQLGRDVGEPPHWRPTTEPLGMRRCVWLFLSRHPPLNPPPPLAVGAWPGLACPTCCRSRLAWPGFPALFELAGQVCGRHLSGRTWRACDARGWQNAEGPLPCITGHGVGMSSTCLGSEGKFSDQDVPLSPSQGLLGGPCRAVGQAPMGRAARKIAPSWLGRGHTDTDRGLYVFIGYKGCASYRRGGAEQAASKSKGRAHHHRYRGQGKT